MNYNINFPFEIIDFHIHPFDANENNFCQYNNVIDNEYEFKNDLNRAGITKACGSVIKKFDNIDFNEIIKLNNKAVELSEKLNGFYIPGFHIHPDYVNDSCVEIERMNSKGINLVGELVPYLMGWEDYYNEKLHTIYELIDKYQMIVSIHTMAEDSIDKALKCFPNIKFVAAHPGEKSCFLRHIERMKKYDNYYLDFSGTGIFRYGLISYGIKQVGNERFLFGTDYPICNPGMYVQAVLYENLKDEDYEAIFYKNAKRILNI